ncbi:MAG: hypothetical protein NTW40_02045 [Acidobacteria bacterium]|nr:hypothetical protein [Acidobacteriota bacterium]
MFTVRGACTDLMAEGIPLVSIAAAATLLRVDSVVVSISSGDAGDPRRLQLLELQAILPPRCVLSLGGSGAGRLLPIPGVGWLPEVGAT